MPCISPSFIRFDTSVVDGNWKASVVRYLTLGLPIERTLDRFVPSLWLTHENQFFVRAFSGID